MVARDADVRDLDQLQTAFDEGVAELGRIDMVVANAGIATYGKAPGARRRSSGRT